MEDLDSFDPGTAAARAKLDRKTVAKAVAVGAVNVDRERTRARYVDGQLLGADGFRRDHRLFDRRQRDLAQLVQRGVVEGLQVRRPFLLDELDVETTEPDPTRLTIEAGHGVTRAGHTIVVRERVEIDLTQLPIFERLDATFGLARRPRAPARTQSGVFALSLRPIEFTANPVAPYPAEITGERRLEDGDVIEASVVTLVPVESESNLDGVDAGPAAVARRVFAERLDPLPLDDALPIALVALERGQVAWLDVETARREASADPGRGFGVGHRSELDAHMRHFASRMAAIIEQRLEDLEGLRFAASDYFEVLPPAGAIPTEAVSIDGARIVQWFFPANIEAELVLVPEDELSELAEEAIHMGPFELSKGARILEASPVLIAVPVPRADFATLAQSMGGVLRRPIARRLGAYSRRRPIEALLRRSLPQVPPAAEDMAPALQPWQDVLESATSLLFFRQRRRARTTFALARYGPIPEEQRPSGTLSALVRDRLDTAGELDRFDRLLATAEPETLERLEVLLSQPVFHDDPVVLHGRLFVNGVMAELSRQTRKRLLEPGTVTVGGASISISGVPAGAPAPLRVRPLRFEDAEEVAQRYEGDPELGDGVATLIDLEGDLDEMGNRLVIAQSLRLPELDRRLRDHPPDDPSALAAQLLTYAIDNDVNGIRELVGYVRPEPPPLSVPLRADLLTPSTGFQYADEQGQGALFKILWDHADEPARTKLDTFLSHEAAHQPLASVVMMMGLVRTAWDVELDGPQDVQLLLEQLYRWPFAPDQRFDLPTLSRRPLVRIRGSAETEEDDDVTDLLDEMEQAGPDIEGAPGVDLEQAGALFEVHGFPPQDVDAVDAYRILGCEFSDLDFLNLTGGVATYLEADFPEFVAAVSEAVSAADTRALRSLYDVWFAAVAAAIGT